MRRPLCVLVLLVLAVLLGNSMAAGAASPNHTRCLKLVSGSISHSELLAYEACRFDKLDAEVAALSSSVPTPPGPGAGSSPTPGASSAPRPSPSVEPTPTPTSTTAPGAVSWRNAGIEQGSKLRRVPQDVASGTGWRSDSKGNVTATSGAAVLTGLLIPGRVDLNRATVTNVKVQCIGENDWCVSVGSGSTVTKVEIGGGANGTTYGHAIGVYTGGSDTAGNVFDRVLIHHQIHGMRVDGGTTVLNSYIRDLPMGDPVKNLRTGGTNTDDHTDGIMSTRNGNVVVRGTRIEGGNTANLFIQHDATDSSAPAIHDWLIEGCEFVNMAKNGQVSSYGVGIDDRPNTTGPFTIRNNTFSRGWEVGPIVADGSQASTTGNVFTDGARVG